MKSVYGNEITVSDGLDDEIAIDFSDLTSGVLIDHRTAHELITRLTEFAGQPPTKQTTREILDALPDGSVVTFRNRYSTYWGRAKWVKVSGVFMVAESGTKLTIGLNSYDVRVDYNPDATKEES